MKINYILFVLFLTSCATKIKEPIQFKFYDNEIEASAKFYKYSKKQNICFGEMSIKNLSSDKRIFVDTAYLKIKQRFSKIYPDSFVPVMVNIRSLDNIKYEIVVNENCLLDEFRNFEMNIGYSMQNDNLKL